MEGAPNFTESQRLHDVDYAAFAAGLGLEAIIAVKPDQIGPAWDRALAAGRPAVLDVRTDPDVPPTRRTPRSSRPRTRPKPCSRATRTGVA
jgi:pyruvate dehydrogenase (quinone)